MIRNRRALQEKYQQLRIKVRALEKQRDQTEDTTAYFDVCVALRNTNQELQEVLKAL